MSKKAKMAVETRECETREQMEVLVGELAGDIIAQALVTDELNGELLVVRARYETRLTELGNEIEAKLPLAEAWLSKNTHLLGNGKSLEMIHGRIGYRTGTPKLKTIKGWKWETVLTWLTNHGLGKYMRVTPEVNKEAIIADRETLQDDGLALMGVKIVQDEVFYLEPRQEPRH